jgi:hypothetical protein
MRKEGKNRLVSMLIVLALMFSMIVLITQPALAAPDIYISKTVNLTYGETIWVNVSGLTTDNDYEVWIWDTAGWETNISEDTADAYGRVSMEVEVPYRNPLGDYYLIVLDVTGTPDPDAPDENETIEIYNTYLVNMKVNGNEVSNLLHNQTYEYGGNMELTFELFNGSDLIDDWDLVTTLADPTGAYVDSKTISNGKWIPNIVTFDYVGDLPNREVNYWLNVTPSSGHTGEWTNISIPVKLNVTTTVSPTDLTYGDEDVTVTVYVKDWNVDDDEDLNVAGYTVSVYAPGTDAADGNYIMVDQDTTGSNGRAILNFDTTDGSAGTWYIGTEEPGINLGEKIDETEKLNIADFISYASFTVNSDNRAVLKIESPDEIVSGFNTTINVSAYVSSPTDPDNDYYDELNIHVTGIDAYYNGIEYDNEDIITISDAVLTGTSSNDKYAYYEFYITFNKTGTGTIIATHPESNDVYMEWANQDLKANITGSITFSVVSPAAMTIIVDNMVEEVLVDETTACRWQNTSSFITVNIYGDNQDDRMNASIEITGCGLDISIDEEDAIDDGYWIDDGEYKIEISPKTAGTVTITVTNDTEDKTVSKDYTIKGLFGTVTTSVGDDLEIPVETGEKITATITNGQYSEVHVTYFDENWVFISCLNDSVGDNTAGNGLNGIFEFDIEKDDIDSGVGYIVVAASAGANYMYDIVEVVPIHDLVVEIITPTNATDLSLTVGLEHTYELKIYDPDGKLMTDIDTVVGEILDEDEDTLQTVNFAEKSGSIWKIQDWEPWFAGTLVITATNDTGVNEHDGNVSLDVGLATISYSPGTATAGIDTEDLDVDVTGIDANGNPLPEGTTLYLNIEDDFSLELDDDTITLDEDATGTFTITCVGDNATKINATLLDYFDEDIDGNKTNGEFSVNYPVFTVTPSEIYINYPTEITIITKDNEGNPLEGINLTLLPSSLGVLSVQPDPVETDENGMVVLSVSPQASGKLNVTIARDVKYVGGQLNWTNAVITDTYITVTGIKTMILTVSKSPIYQGETLTVTVNYGATPIADVDVTLGMVTVKTGSDGTAQFTVPDPGVEYAIMKVIAKKTGYISESEDITVLKKWEIKISVSGDIKTETEFTVTVVAKGSGLAGSTVTFQSQTKTTDNDGKATFTAPTEPGTYTLTASYENMQTATLSVTVGKAESPGFELITLIIAIGVAFILLRRRRK